MAADMHLLPEDGGGRIPSLLASIGVSCHESDLAPPQTSGLAHAREFDPRARRTRFVCCRDGAEIWVDGTVSTAHGGGRPPSNVYVVRHLHNHPPGRGWRQSFRDERLRRDVRTLMRTLG